MKELNVGVRIETMPVTKTRTILTNYNEDKYFFLNLTDDQLRLLEFLESEFEIDFTYQIVDTMNFEEI